MSRLALSSSLLLLLAAAAAAPPRRSRARAAGNPVRIPPPNLRDYGNTPIWPLPANAVPVVNTHLDPASFQIVVTPQLDFLTTLAARYMDHILYLPTPPNPVAPSSPILATLSVNVANVSSLIPQQDTDESYTLSFSLDGTAATITAATVFGARHGLESFSQLIYGDRLAGTYSLQGLNISEAPRFPYRGLLVDSARHWLPPLHLLQIMDAMSFNKMNALQVGFGIDWSWTVESLAFPNLTDSSYGPHQTHVFNQSTIAWLVGEAALRGVRLIPYLEVLSHEALSYAVPELMWCNGVQGKGGLPHPLVNATWEFFDTLWADLRNIFPENYVNVGGDELDATCWENDPLIAAWNSQHGYPNGDTTHVLAYFYTRLMGSLAKVGFKPIFFAEAFGSLNASGVDLTGTDVIFDAWDEGTPGSAAPIIEAPGTQVIISSYCFLAPTNSCPDNLPGGATPNWFTNIACEIQNQTLFPQSAWPYLNKIVGGHPSRWGEQTDATNLFVVTWPAVMGAAEKLWSPAALTNGSFFGTRQEVFADHRCLHIRRGSPVQPTSAYSWSCDFEWEPVYPPLTPKRPNGNYSSWVYPGTSGEIGAVGGTAGVSERERRLEQRVRELEERVRVLGG